LRWRGGRFSGALPRLPRLGPLYRTLALKIGLLAVVFVVVPVILYRLIEIGDAQQAEILKRSVELQGNLITSVVQPYLERFDKDPPDALQKALTRVVPAGASVKVLVSPGAGQGAQTFLYVAAVPAVSADYLKQERELLIRLGVFDRLAPSCEGDEGSTVQFTNPAGKAEVLTSLRSLHIGDSCWVIIASQGTQAMLSSAVGEPIWRSPAVHIAAMIYLLSVLIVAWLFTDIWRNLNRFRAVARSIRLDRAGGMTFRQMNTIPELTGVADDFDALVGALKQSKNFIVQAAEENAHALKAPLAVIAQAIEPLRRAVQPENAQARRSIELIERSTARLDSLLSAARDLEQVAVEAIYPNLRRMDLSACVTQLVSAYEPTLTLDGKTLRCAIQLDVHIDGSEEGLEAILENLLENAASFSPRPGTVEVSLTVIDDDACLVVADNGPGVAEEDLPRIFQRHFSARPGEPRGDGDQQHYGLGLWIARRNAEAMAGTLMAENRPQGGFAVTVRFKSIS
jgi:two-component system sensor histidine kinase ChvG